MDGPPCRRILVLLLTLAYCTCCEATPAHAAEASAVHIFAGSSFVLLCTLLAFVALPGVALFYGGLVRAKNVLSTMLLALVGSSIGFLLWLTIGQELAFGSAERMPLLHGLLAAAALAFWSGTLAERVRFGRFCLLASLWLLLVFAPAVHVFGGPKGQIAVIDPAGGLTLHLAIGCAGLAFSWRGKDGAGAAAQLNPSSLALTLAGAGLLLAGWLALAAAVAAEAGRDPTLAAIGTLAAALAAALAWLGCESAHHHKPTALGFASGIVAGLAAFAPLTGAVGVVPALMLGATAGVASHHAVLLKRFLPAQDPHDVFALHGVGGLVGLAAAGLHSDRWGVHLLATVGVAGWSLCVSWLLLKLLDRTLGLFARRDELAAGLDLSLHGQAGFDLESELGGAQRRLTVEPRSAEAPPTLGLRYSLLVEGVEEEELRMAWSGLCQAGVDPTPEFLAVYPHLTTVAGTRFRFRGGQPQQVQSQFERLLRDRLRTAGVRARLELEPLRQAA